MLEELIKREADVLGDLTEQNWGNVSTLMNRHGSAAANGIAELLVGAALANFGEAESKKNGYDITGFQDGNIAHGLRYGNVLNSNELGLQRGFSVFDKHCNDFTQVVIDFVQSFPLRMSSGKAGNETNEQACLGAPLNYR